MPPTPASPSPTITGSFVYAPPEPNKDELDDTLTDLSNEHLDADDARRSQSLYVDIFESILETVVREEGALFNGPELDCFGKYSKLAYCARVLLVRICLRKTEQWIKLADLKYQRELGPDGVLPALRTLCSKPAKPHAEEDIQPKIEEREIIDLTAEANAQEAAEVEIVPEPDYSFFARDESDASLEELLYSMRVDDLKDLVKQLRVKPRDSRRETLIFTLLHTSAHQRTLLFDSPVKGKGKAVLKPPDQRTLHAWSPGKNNAPPRQSTLNYTPVAMSGTTMDRLRELVLQKLSACIQVNSDVVKLFHRVNLVYFRCITLTPLLTPAILARTNKWSFAHHPRPQAPAAATASAPVLLPQTSVLSPSSSQSSASSYTPGPSVIHTPPTSQPIPTSSSSTATAGPSDAPEPETSALPYARTRYRLWPTREDLLAYERALALERRVDELSGNSGGFYPGARSAAASAHARAVTASVRGASARAPTASAASPYSTKSAPVLGASPWERFKFTRTPSTARGRKRVAQDEDESEYEDSAAEEGEEDVLPVLAEAPLEEDGDCGFAFVPALVAADELVWRSGKTKMQKPPPENNRVDNARLVVELGREVFEMWCAIPEIRDALEKAAATAHRNSDILPKEEVKEEVKEEEPMPEMDESAGEDADAVDEGVKAEVDEWEMALRTRSQQFRIDEAAKREAEANANLETEGKQEPLWMSQFHHGYILTRILSKTACALRTLHQQRAALHLYTHLLAQRVFRRGRRGRWHDERLLILSEYAPKCRTTLGREWMYVHDALEDEDTHVVWRPKLERRREDIRKRLAKAGADLGEPQEGSAFQKWPEVTIQGERIYPQEEEVATSRVSASPMKKKRKVETPDAKQSTLASFVKVVATASNDQDAADVKAPKPATGKSIWKGKDDAEVSVEIFALEHYQSEGWKGLHSEGGVLTTLFALLFFDIIFTPIPGAFETPYQVAPLDIGSDTFYLARRHLFDARLAEIAAGRAPEIGLATWDREATRKTWCVGLRWDLLKREDWAEILAYWEPAALALVCRTLVEDYVNRTSGVPDLFIWHSERRECKFVEVKGPGDNLQENQKLWMEAFLRANAKVEVCHVEDINKAKPARKFKTPAKAKAHAKKLFLKPKPASPKKRKTEEVIVIESNEEPAPADVHHAHPRTPIKVERRMKPAKVEVEVEVKQEPTPRRSARARVETKYRFDVEEEVVRMLEAQGEVPVAGPSSRKRKRDNQLP